MDAGTVEPMSSSAPPRSAGRPRSATADQAILETTIRLLGEQGYDAMSIEGIAAAAGVGKTTIYRRYPGKRDVVIAAISTLVATPTEPPDSGSTREDLVDLIREMLDLLFRTGIGYSMIGTLLVKEREEPMLIQLFREHVIQPRYRLVSSVLRRGVERGELRSDLDPAVVLPMMIGSTFARHLAGLPEDDEWLNVMVDAMWSGIAAP